MNVEWQTQQPRHYFAYTQNAANPPRGKITLEPGDVVGLYVVEDATCEDAVRVRVAEAPDQQSMRRLITQNNDRAAGGDQRLAEGTVVCFGERNVFQLYKAAS